MRTPARFAARGASLLELIVAISMGVVLLLLVTRYFAVQNWAYQGQMRLSELRMGVRAVMDLMARDIRSAGYDPTGRGKWVGLARPPGGDTNTIWIRADLNGDGDLADSNENVGYSYVRDSKVIQRVQFDTLGVTRSREEILDGVDSFRVELRSDRDSVLTVAADSARIRQVYLKVTVTAMGQLGVRRETGGKQVLSQELRIAPRNLAL